MQRWNRWVVPTMSFASAIVLAYFAGPNLSAIGRQAGQPTNNSLKITDFSISIPAGTQTFKVTSVAKAVNIMTVNCAFGFNFFDKDGKILQVKTPTGGFATQLINNINGVNASSGTVTENFTLGAATVDPVSHKAVKFAGVQGSYTITSVMPAGFSDSASAEIGNTPGPNPPPPGQGLIVTITGLVPARAGNTMTYSYTVTATGAPGVNTTAPFDGTFQLQVIFKNKRGVAQTPFNITTLISSQTGQWTGAFQASTSTAFATATGTLTVAATDSSAPPNTGSNSLSK